MGLKRAMVYLDMADGEKRQAVEKGVSRVLVTYPNSVLVDVDEGQIESIKRQGIRLELREGDRMVRLRTVEFDTSKGAPSLPQALRLSAADVESGGPNYWIVQLIGPIKEGWSEEISKLGGTLGNYIPENAFLVKMDSKTKDKVEKLPFVNWITLYEPAYKISPLFMGTKERVSPRELGLIPIKSDAFRPALEGNIIIILHNPMDMTKVSEVIKNLGGKVIATGNDVIRASLDLSELDKVAKMTEVKWVEPYALPKLFNDAAAVIIGADSIWNSGSLNGEGQTVAVADTGLDTGVDDESLHDDFKGRIVTIHDRVGDGSADMNSGHGTHVAGSVLGSGSRSNGKYKGMAFAAHLVFQALEHKITQGLAGIPADLKELFQEAYDDGARIHTNSWGSSLTPWGVPMYGQYTADSRNIDEFVWNHKDMAILFAAGNDGKDQDKDGVVDPDSLATEACAKNCITVGASENDRSIGGYNPGGDCEAYGECWPDDFPADPIKSDGLSNNPKGMVAFSSRGPTDDQRIKPDVVAPGTNILSVRSSKARETGWGLLPPDDPNRRYYMYMGGTSMATPLVAGIVALIRQYLQNVRQHGNPSAALLKAVLIHGATSLAGQYAPPEVGPIPDNNQGWGRVNLKGSILPDDPVKVEIRDDPTDALGTGDQKEFGFNVVNDSVPLKVTLVWTDYPGEPSAGGGLVNTLRLSITSPNGETLLASPANNNVQQVTVNAPKVGTYKILVEGLNIATQAINNEKQEFALVIRGGL